MTRKTFFRILDWLDDIIPEVGEWALLCLIVLGLVWLFVA